MAWIVLVLSCLCILLAYIRKEPEGAAVPAVTPTPGDEPKDPRPSTQLEQLIQSMMPTPVPLPAAWEQIAGARISVLPRRLKDMDVIVLEKGEGYGEAELWLEELPTTRQISVTISGIRGSALSDGQVKRIAKGTYYEGTPPTPTPTPIPTPTPANKDASTPVPSAIPSISPSDPYYVWQNDMVKGIVTTQVLEGDGSLTQTLLLTLDKTYVYYLYEDEFNYYIALIRPKDVYGKIVVVDAGHGGIDEGTLVAGREHMEKDINLDIVLRLKELLDAQDGIKVYYTRTTDWKPSLQQRVDLANDVEADFFLSVHCNSNETRSLNGTEVLFDSRQDEWEEMNSRRFAEIILEELDGYSGFLNRGLVPREHNLSIIKYAEVPVALVEVGYLSNETDLGLLIQNQTRQRVAQGLYQAILHGYEEMEKSGIEAEKKE
ncbi:MAG: N-acetylmuramoyl-L-alanine amidase [Lachnospiraceae bacterium]|nr:N-acetylmuramoyl-L-alanine amidase [Lachnospiraceae bacterium]